MRVGLSRKILLPLLLTALLSPLAAAPALAKGQKKIALLMAANQERIREIQPSQITGACTAAFFESRRFEVMERDQLAKIFDERELSDFINGAPGDLSNLHGVDYLGLISYTTERTNSLQQGGKPVEMVYIDIRLTDVKSGQISGSVSSRRPSAAIEPTTVHYAGRLLLENIREMFPPEGSVLNVGADGVVVVSLGSAEGIEDGDSLEVIQDGEILFDAEGNAYPPLENIVASLKVTQVAPLLSKCKIKKGGDAISIGARVRLQPGGQRWMEPIQKIMPWIKNRLSSFKK